MGSDRSRIDVATIAIVFSLLGSGSILHAAPSEPTETQKASARAFMDEGYARRAAGDNKGALESFRAAYALVKAPRTGVEVGRTLLDLGRWLEARDAFLEVVKMPKPPNEPQPAIAARAEAQALADDLGQRIPTVRVETTNAPGAATVTIDGNDRSVDASAPIPLDPGEHHLRATSEGVERTADVTLAERDRKTITLDFSPSTPQGATIHDEPSPPRTWLWIGVATAGVGVVAGSISGLLAFSKASAAKSACDGTQCPPPHDDLDASRRWGTISNVSFAVAGVGAVIAVVSLLAPSSSSSSTPTASVSPWIGLGSAGVTGSF